MYKPPHVKFRMARLLEGECSASECSLIANDYWNAGYGRIIMVPRVKLAYDKVCVTVSLKIGVGAKLDAFHVARLRYHSPITEESHYDSRIRPPWRLTG